MSRKIDQTIYQHRFNLTTEFVAQIRLHEYLAELAKDGNAAAWIIETLIAAMPKPRLAPAQPYRQPSVPNGKPKQPPVPTSVPGNDVTYEDLEE